MTPATALLVALMLAQVAAFVVWAVYARRYAREVRAFQRNANAWLAEWGAAVDEMARAVEHLAAKVAHVERSAAAQAAEDATL